MGTRPKLYGPIEGQEIQELQVGRVKLRSYFHFRLIFKQMCGSRHLKIDLRIPNLVLVYPKTFLIEKIAFVKNLMIHFS